jgi:uncharacterized protein (TIGR03118 family)
VEPAPLTGSTTALGVTTVDTMLVNAWGLIFDPNGNAWVASNGRGMIVVYDTAGKRARGTITVPARASGAVGTPTGLVLNTTTGFSLPGGGQPATVLAATEDGLITAWRSGDSAVIVARGDTNAVYTGLAQAASNGNTYLYAANFKQRRIDVFDTAFNRVAGSMFVDNSIPADYAPFNIVNINNNLYVTYAKQNADSSDAVAGIGNGFVNIFRANGNRVQRFVSQDSLDAPWGVEMTSNKFDTEFNVGPVILIGNFGNGRINAYDESGMLIGQLGDDGTAIVIDGLWAIKFPKNSNLSDSTAMRLYFTAGPDDESRGLFGYLRPEAADSTGDVADTTQE